MPYFINRISRPASRLSVLIIIVFFAITNFSHQLWKIDKGPIRGVIKWDVISYYAFLPATFIYHDIGLDFLNDEDFNNDNKFWYQLSSDGNKLIITTMGMSYLYAPFFFTAHLVAPAFGEDRSGFNSCYQFFLLFSALFYVWLGFLFMRKILNRFFPDIVAAITIILIGLGTNLYNYATYEAPMSHAYNFCLITGFIFLIIRWYDDQKIGYAILIGLLYGLITLIRPTNVMVIILLLLWGVSSPGDFRKRFLFLVNKAPQIFLMFIAFILPWLPQFFYWKYVTGNIFYNSYEQVGSAFYFDSPHILDMLLSYRKGWFIYTPVMLVACTGIIFLYRDLRESFLSISLYFLAMVYLLSSWWSWWYGGSFGLRAMIDLYGVMAIPLAVVIDRTLKLKLILRYSLLAIPGFLIFLNIYQTWQYQEGYIHYYGMNKETYWLTFLKGTDIPGYWTKLSIPDFDLARKGIYVFYPSGENHDNLKSMSEEKALGSIRNDVLNNRRLMRDIRRYSRRNNQTKEHTIKMVTEQIYSQKMIDQ